MKQLIFFLAVGGTAALVHLLVVAALVPWFELSPLWANLVGFLLAFQVSYWGHRCLTFKAQAQQTTHKQAMSKFFAVAVGSFCLNQGLYAGLLAFTGLDYRVALFIVLFVVAVVTFMISKVWAFNAKGETQ
ncbi:GtrA family protein [Pseudomonas sp. F1_0610]|uniref:GtrA family protein n=1 Tax=Pseudomonas sp. F1_0610 TaxID=3114284 RepID=UPI0039C4C167